MVNGVSCDCPAAMTSFAQCPMFVVQTRYGNTGQKILTRLNLTQKIPNPNLIFLT